MKKAFLLTHKNKFQKPFLKHPSFNLDLRPHKLYKQSKKFETFQRSFRIASDHRLFVIFRNLKRSKSEDKNSNDNNSSIDGDMLWWRPSTAFPVQQQNDAGLERLASVFAGMNLQTLPSSKRFGERNCFLKLKIIFCCFLVFQFYIIAMSGSRESGMMSRAQFS